MTLISGTSMFQYTTNNKKTQFFSNILKIYDNMPILETKKLEKILSTTAKNTNFIKTSRSTGKRNLENPTPENQMDLEFTQNDDLNMEPRIRSPEKDE